MVKASEQKKKIVFSLKRNVSTRGMTSSPQFIV